MAPKQRKTQTAQKQDQDQEQDRGRDAQSSVKTPQAKDHKKEGRAQRRIWPLFIAVVVVVVLWWRFRPLAPETPTNNRDDSLSNDAPSNNSTSTFWKGEQTIPVLEMDPTRPFAKEVASKAVPVVLRNTKLHKSWRAIGTWTPQYILEKLGKDNIIKYVWNSPKPIIYLHRDDADVGKYPDIEPGYHLEDIKVENLLERLQNPETYGYYYVFRPIDELGDLLKDVQPTTIASPFDYEAHKPIKQSVQLWMGSRGVTTQMHHDADENFHIQLTGNKRFLLFPPQTCSKLYLFPKIHPNYRRSQLNMGDDSSSLDRSVVLSLMPEALEVTLGPGDMLYIPPFWFHHVVNENAGLSINVWTHVPARQLAVQKLNARPTFLPPQLQALGPGGQSLFIRGYLLHLVAKIIDSPMTWLPERPANPVETARQIIAAHFDQRYRRLVLADKTVKEDAILKDVCEDADEKLRESQPEIQQTIKQFYGTFSKVFEYDPTGLQLHVADHLDLMAWKSVEKDHRRVAAFFSYCFLGQDPVTAANTLLQAEEARFLQ